MATVRNATDHEREFQPHGENGPWETVGAGETVDVSDGLAVELLKQPANWLSGDDATDELFAAAQVVDDPDEPAEETETDVDVDAPSEPEG